MLVTDARLQIDRFGLEEAGLGFGLLHAGLSTDSVSKDLDDRLRVLEIGLWIDLFKSEEAEGLLLFKPRLFCIYVLSNICFMLAYEERFTIVVEASGNELLGNVRRGSQNYSVVTKKQSSDTLFG